MKSFPLSIFTQSCKYTRRKKVGQNKKMIHFEARILIGRLARVFTSQNAWLKVKHFCFYVMPKVPHLCYGEFFNS